VSGLVSLVGAGPGDPELLTRKAARRLEEADLVLYDALVDPAVLDLAGRARRFYVGKRAGRPHMGQEQIERIMVRAARSGARVVRLKGGDPFVFGRGGEEALALAAAGIAFEVVPGISAAVAAPALAGIPVTHRGLSTGFVVVSGHAEAAWRPALESLAPNALTVVVLMGLAHRATLASLLLARGWAPETPAAIVWAASRREGSSWRGTLVQLAGSGVSIAAETADAPGTIVVGAVVSLAEALAPAAEHSLTAAGGSR
jgi:uroporphyrin-III C-methyltransferase / precorrin-2 dehydrogenase / sirohydrochlorin ferrochelatase